MSRTDLRISLDKPYDVVLAQIPELLKENGFGVLTNIDVAATLKAKLDVDFRRYTILGACNPKLAYRALSADLDVGVLLPCNVAVYEDGGKTVVAIVDPLISLASEGDPGLRELAAEARSKLENVITKLGSS